MKCDDCKAAGIEAVATRTVGKKHYCSSHARKYFSPGMALPPENPHLAQLIQKKLEEKKMPTGRLDSNSILADHKAGMSDVAIAEKYGCHFTTVSMHLRKMGIFRAGQGGKRRTERRASENATPASQAIVSRPDDRPVPVPLPDPRAANGHVRCRVAMFEVEGDATAIQHAVDAVKAAIEGRASRG